MDRPIEQLLKPGWTAIFEVHIRGPKSTTLPGWTRRVPHNFVTAIFKIAGDVTAMPAGFGILSLVLHVFPIVPAGA